MLLLGFYFHLFADGVSDVLNEGRRRLGSPSAGHQLVSSTLASFELQITRQAGDRFDFAQSFSFSFFYGPLNGFYSAR